MTTETIQQDTTPPARFERWQDFVQQKSPEELWHDLQNARFWFRMSAIAAFFGSLFFSISYFCGGNLTPQSWDGENWGNAGLAVLITGAITIWQYKLYLVRSSAATKATLLAAGLAAFFGIFSEVSHSLSREEASVRHRSQSSPVFQAMVNQINSAGTVAPSSTGFEAQIASAKTEMVTAKMKLARCEENVANGKWKDCVESTTRLKAVQAKITDLSGMAQERISNQLQAQQQTTLAMAEKAKSMEYDESQSYPMIRAFKELLGFSTIGAGLLFSLIVMGVFEYALHWQGHYTADLEYALRRLGYNTGKFKKRPHERLEPFKRKAKQFSEQVSPALNLSGVIPSGYGFKMQQSANNAPSPEVANGIGNQVTAKSDQPVNTDRISQIKAAQTEISRLKAMKASGGDETRAATAEQEATTTPPTKQPAGFVDTNQANAQKKIQGSQDHQYPLYLSKALQTGKANSPAQVAEFLDIATGKNTPSTPPAPDTDKTVSGTVSRNTVSTVPARSHSTVPDRARTVKTVQNKTVSGTVPDSTKTVWTDEAKQAVISLYPEWLAQVKSREISPGARACKKYISQQTKNGKSATGLTVQEMGRMWQVWQKKAANDGVLILNPKYSPAKTGVAKYVLA